MFGRGDSDEDGEESGTESFGVQDLEPTPEQTYEYDTYSLGFATKNMKKGWDGIERKMNEYAAEGWEYIDRIESDGTTVRLVFRREV